MTVKQTMSRTISIALNTFMLGLLIASTTVNARSAKLDDAIKVYYSGLPDQAIAMIMPLAQSGDPKAQLLLGNILHSLSRSDTNSPQADPVTWYQMAAAQGSSEANYLLGVIYHNRWTETQEKDSDTIAIAYYETAAKLGNKAAQGPLIQLKYRDKKTGQKASQKTSPKTSKAKLKPVEAPTQKVVMPIATEKVETPEETTAIKVETVATVDILEEPLPTATVLEATAEEKEILAIALANSGGADQVADEILNQVDLQDVVTECKNYTKTGFGYYAESINGAHLTGSATILSIEPNTESDDSLTINLVKKQLDIELLLSLKAVPSAVGNRFKKSAIVSISGIVRHAQKIQKNCEIDLTFKPIKLQG